MAEEMGLDIDWDEVEAREAEEKAKQEAMEMGLAPGAGAIDPATGLPMEGAPAEEPIPEGAEEQVESLDDVVALLVAKAEMEAGVSEVEGQQTPPAGQPAPARGQTTPPNGQAPAPAGAKGAAAKKSKRKTPGEQAMQFGLTGLTEDMLDWADQMVALSGKDYRDG